MIKFPGFNASTVVDRFFQLFKKYFDRLKKKSDRRVMIMFRGPPDSSLRRRNPCTGVRGCNNGGSFQNQTILNVECMNKQIYTINTESTVLCIT